MAVMVGRHERDGESKQAAKHEPDCELTGFLFLPLYLPVLGRKLDANEPKSAKRVT